VVSSPCGLGRLHRVPEGGGCRLPPGVPEHHREVRGQAAGGHLPEHPAGPLGRVGAPDVSVIEDSHLAQFVKLGGLADVTDLVKPYTDQVNAYRWKPATRDGRVYAMPWDSGPVARNDARLLEMLLWQQGLGYVDAQGNVILDKDPRIQRTLEFMGRFWREGLSLDTEWWQDPWYKALGGGKVATIPEAVWMGTFFRDFIDPKGTGHWGVFKLPVWEPGGSQASNDGGSTLAIFEQSKQSKQKDAPWAYVEYHLTRPESQLQIYEETDIFPALETTYQDPFFQEPSEYFVLMAGSVVSVLPMLLLFLLLQRHLVVGLTAGAVRE
jgi:lactose/L-arabinose transport system substrate-binding protein